METIKYLSKYENDFDALYDALFSQLRFLGFKYESGSEAPGSFSVRTNLYDIKAIRLPYNTETTTIREGCDIFSFLKDNLNALLKGVNRTLIADNEPYYPSAPEDSFPFPWHGDEVYITTSLIDSKCILFRIEKSDIKNGIRCANFESPLSTSFLFLIS